MSTITTTVIAPELTGTYRVDPAHSRVGFVARHAMVAKVRGAFAEFEGHGHLDAADPARSHLELRIQAASITTGSADRDAHLRSPDFFDPEQHPELHFVSTAIEPVDEARFRVTGDLTIKGVTRPVTLDVEYAGASVDPWGGQRIGLEASVVVNRKDWGLTWNVALEAGGVLVSDKVTLEIEVSAVKDAA